MLSRNQIFFLFLIVLSSAKCYKILCLFPHPGKSHFDVVEPLLKKLAAKGHEVTVVSYCPQKIKIPNYIDINLSENTPAAQDVFDIKNFTAPTDWDKLVHPTYLAEIGRLSCEDSFSVSALQDFIKSDRKFDVILAEFFNSDCFLGFMHKFKAPFIGLSTGHLMPWDHDRFGTPSNPSYIPSLFIGLADKMTFFERVKNTVSVLMDQIFHDLLIEPSSYEIAKRHFGDDLPPLREIGYNASLVFVNTHHSLHSPRAQVPGIIEIGGVHIPEPKKLPEDLETWSRDSSFGIIYFSLGSLIKGESLPEDKRAMFIRIFSELPTRVIWKYENDTLPGIITDLIKIGKWLPQFDILCHPNTKVFISHGGLLGITEAVHCGVPTLVMPQYGDQFTNARALEAGGGGKVVDFWTANETTILEAIKSLLTNVPVDDTAAIRAKKLSKRFKDRPMPPLDTAIYWVEYVARHGGAHHMRTAAVGMPLYKYLLLDVLAFLTAILVTLFLMLYYTIKVARRLLLTKAKEKTS